MSETTTDSYDDVFRSEVEWVCGRCGTLNQADVSDVVCSLCSWTGGEVSDKAPSGLRVNLRKIVTQA